MHHYIHKLVANIVCCLVLGRLCTAGLWSYLKKNKQTNIKLPAVAKSDTMRMGSLNQNSKVVGWTAKQWAKTLYKAP